MSTGNSTLANAGKTWTRELREALKEDFEKGLDLETLATQHGRSAGAIIAKLVEMGLLVQNRDGFYFRVEADPWTNWIEAKRIDGTLRDNPTNAQREYKD
ncbi:hypothetical protein WK13_34660 [Burkholderia ubonensis]|uniref:hypothetical protein n=1 Tax=Burkholderia ubonensis TaxID=101571 RepID=UPI0007583343|nr:hypothetical protein [Burkholderia ubonensis]KVR21682.1 hypothetical protein WK13_34660 [Burkholderia ubonensis]